MLEEAGATVLVIPTIEVVEPLDAGAALRDAVDHIDRYDWVVLTSINGVRQFAQVLGRRSVGETRFAVVGPGTADALRAAGLEPSLIPDRFVAEALVEAFATAPASGGRVLVAQADQARSVVSTGLQQLGWTVDIVIAYRTQAASVPADVVAAIRAADAITFTSGSTVRSFVASAGLGAMPPVVVCIGPVTASVANELGVSSVAVAHEHSLAGLVGATVAAVTKG
jgi:uroporphyrinogen III methyltransferase / synthase